MESLGNSLSLILSINGITCSEANSKIFKVTIEESIPSEFPLLQISALLKNEFIAAPIYDGAVVELTVEYPEHVKRSKEYGLMRYRVFYYEAHEVSNEIGLQYLITCMPEEYYKLNTISDQVFEGSSSSVFSGIGKALKIGTDLCNTNDTQVWFNLDGNRISLLRHTCLHSFIDILSVMCWWVDRYGILHLKNFTDDIMRETTWKFLHNTDESVEKEPNVVIINSPQYISVSGENNTKEGYGKFGLVFSPQDNKHEAFRVQKFYSGAEQLNVNREIANPMKYDSLGLNTTNVHPYYFQAEEQNQRGRALYSNIIECFAIDLQDVLLGDTVYYEMKMGGTVEGVAYTGKYIIIGIETVFSGRNTMAKYTLARQGISVKSNEAA